MNLGRIFLTFFTTEDKPDALWATLVEGQDAWYTDRSGRRHRVKACRHVPVMFALGVWPESGRSAVLDFEMGDGPGEDRGSWLCLLTRLEARGLRPECDLQLSVYDGCSALMAVLEEVFPDVPRQRGGPVPSPTLSSPLAE